MRPSTLPFLLTAGMLLASPSAQAQSPEAEIRLLQAQVDNLQQRLAQSESEQQASAEQTRTLHTTLQNLQQENLRLHNQPKIQPHPPLLSEQQLWFLIGAGCSIFSLLLGVFLRRRRQPQWFR